MRQRELSVKTVISWQKIKRYHYISFIAEINGRKLRQSEAGISRTGDIWRGCDVIVCMLGCMQSQYTPREAIGDSEDYKNTLASSFP
jgi:hypothetical protein